MSCGTATEFSKKGGYRLQVANISFPHSQNKFLISPHPQLDKQVIQTPTILLSFVKNFKVVMGKNIIRTTINRMNSVNRTLKM